MIDYTLKSGSHQSREKGMCAMEWVAAAEEARAVENAAAASDASSDAAAKRQMWEKLLPSALELFERMLLTEAVELPTEMERQFQALCEAVA